MGMPSSACTRLKSHAGTAHACRIRCLKQWIDSYGASKPLGRPFRGRLRASSFDFHLLNSLNQTTFSGINCRKAAHSQNVISVDVSPRNAHLAARKEQLLAWLISFPSTHDEAAIHRDGLTCDVACGITAKPQNSISNLLGATNPSHRDALFHRFEGLTLTGRDHLVGHRCPNQPRTYGIDSNAPCGVFESRALCEPNYSVLGSVVDPTLGTSHKSPKRGTIDDGSTSLFAHLLQLELPATPYTLEVDPHHPVVVFPGSISSLCENILNAGIVVSRVEPAESSDRLFHHSLHLRVVGHVTADGQCLMTFIGKLLGC